MTLFCVISPNLVAFWADYVKVIEDRHILFTTEESSFYRYVIYGDIHEGYCYRDALFSLRSYIVGQS